jgi:hypothetical protein
MCAVIQPLPFAPAANTDLLVVIAASSLIPVALIAGRRLTVSRLAGWCFLGCYIAYMVFLIQRG